MTSRMLTCFTTFALVGLLVAAPPLTIKKTSNCHVFFFTEGFQNYKAEHDIVNLIAPINSLNFEENSSDSLERYTDTTLFFVEADIQPDGSRVEQGLSVLRQGKAKKILDYGRDAAASADDSSKVFFGAKDGLHVYNEKTNSADKYGPITDSIIGIAKEKTGDVIYILTEDREVYKVTDNGEKKEKLDDVVKAKQIVLDYENNLYFYSDDKEPYVRTADGVKKIEGLPESTGSVILLRPPCLIVNGAPVIINNRVYMMYPNGTSEGTVFGFQPDALPTTLAPEIAVVQYYAYDKKIFELNILNLVASHIVENVSNYFKKKEALYNALDSKEDSLKRRSQ